jgi:hypothetical protein
MASCVKAVFVAAPRPSTKFPICKHSLKTENKYFEIHRIKVYANKLVGQKVNRAKIKEALNSLVSVT